MKWLLLLHQIPPKPPYFRAKILRRLNQLGAWPVKNSAYLLPDTEETREDFEWICREITTEGGAAWLFSAEALSGVRDEEIEESFRQMRTADYEELIAAAGELLELEHSSGELGRLQQRLVELKRIDYFFHPSRTRLEEMLARLESRAEPVRKPPAPAAEGRFWVTRRGIKVDRIGSAWLIRRFIDPSATFRFVDASTYRHSEPEIRFDMYEGEFTHEGEKCTFEVLVARYELAAQHPGLQALAEMIHDIDLKDGRYGHPETSGLSRMLDGLAANTADDFARLERGCQIFDALYGSFA